MRSGEGLCPFPENFSSQNGMIWCILDVLFLRFTCPMDCSCMINFIEVPVCAQILGGRQHRTTPAGQILGGGVATPATPAALTPMHAARRRPYHSVCRARSSGVTIIFVPPANIRYGPQSTFEPLIPVQIDSRLHCKMCQCTVYVILTVRRLHYHRIG